MTTSEDSTSTTTEDRTPIVTWADRYVPVGETTEDEDVTTIALRHAAELQIRVDELTAERDLKEEQRVLAVQQLAALRVEFNGLKVANDNQLLAMQEQMDRRLQRAREEAREELDRFKALVVEIADRYARQHNLCSVVDEALEEAGLERPRFRYRGEITFTVSFETGLRNRRDLPDNGWVETSIQTSEVMDAIRDSFEMDSDHEDTEINDISYRVRNVQETE